MDPQDGLDGVERQRLVQLALSDWSAAADARVDSVVVSSSRAAVNLFVNGDYEYTVYFRRNGHGQWDEAGSSNGHADQSGMDALDHED